MGNQFETFQRYKRQDKHSLDESQKPTRNKPSAPLVRGALLRVPSFKKPDALAKESSSSHSSNMPSALQKEPSDEQKLP